MSWKYSHFLKYLNVFIALQFKNGTFIFVFDYNYSILYLSNICKYIR
uniref:Uncharacterized protein n=1 Tax=Anguilla anguilla TaxID=7936 RepID=A0A0E9U1K3_ANGAN